MNQCNNGHFYDAERHTACPYCAAPIDIPPPGRTVAMRPGPPAAAPPPQALPTPQAPATQPMRPAAGATVRLGGESLGIVPVVGWLVCIHGPGRGRDFRLHGEKNFIGRDPSMDVVLDGDIAVSRIKHAAVAFEPEKRDFWLLPGDSAGLAYLNDEVVHAPARMRDRDTIRVGKSHLKLIVFAGEDFDWSNGADREPQS